MSDYTPTTEEIEDWWAHKGTSQRFPYYASKLTKRVNEFRAWLAEHDAKVRAETLREFARTYREGYQAGYVLTSHPADYAREVAERIEKEAGL